MDAERMACAVARVEELGCVVLSVRAVNTGRFELDVRMGLAAANALAFAVARKEALFLRNEQYARIAS
jgi:hypothetical protein